MLPIVHFSFERWRKNTEFGVWVSNQGRVRLLKNKRWLELRVNETGYLTVFTEKGLVLVHRLVAYTWLGDKRNEKYTVDHINSNKRDNRVKNLRWVTEEINQAYAQYTQTSAIPVKETEPQPAIEQDERYRMLMKNKKFDEVTRGRAALALFEEGKLAINTEVLNFENKEILQREHQKMANGTSLEKFVGRILKASDKADEYCGHHWIVKEI